MIIKVAVAGPFTEALDYLPGPYNQQLQAGMRVVVPLQNRQKVGVVIGISEDSQLSEHRLKAIIEVFDDGPLPNDLLDLINWAAKYYHYPIGMAMESALPAGFRRVTPMQLPAKSCWQLSEAGKALDSSTLKRAPKQQELINILREKPSDSDQLNAVMRNWRPVIKRLEDMGLVIEKPFESGRIAEHQTTLNDEQQLAVERVCQKLEQHHTFLLHGVTGSGKTEVYLSIVEQAVKKQQQCLLLVPEIGLTPQTLTRFMQRFGTSVASVHSGLSDGERLTIWQQVQSGAIRVLIGTRSALFAPFQNLACIIVDEEHDRSFKQQEGFRYHARDLAIYRGHLLQIPVVLGSATPSFESLHKAKSERYTYLRLSQRAGKALPPAISVVDSTLLHHQDNITPTLREAMQAHLARGEQVLLFLNRRGYAPAVICKACRSIVSCHRCDAKLTYHAHKKRMVCHHCGYECAKPTHCSECQHTEFIHVGSGTERLEEELQQYFADYQIVRIDRDTTRRKGALQENLAKVRDGQAQILLGTQMLAKGHDFPNVTLVGMINIDQGLFSMDFRGAEHMAQLIVQVAGRSGRSDKKGKAIIQSALPEHPLLRCLIEQGFDVFSDNALQERQSLQLPPYSYAALIRAEASDRHMALRFLTEAAKLISDGVVQKLGPATAPMEKRAGRYRAQLWLQSTQRKNLHQSISQMQTELSSHKSLQQLSRKVRWSIDIDPVEAF